MASFARSPSQWTSRGGGRGAPRITAEGGRRARGFAERRQPADRAHRKADRPRLIRAHARRPRADRIRRALRRAAVGRISGIGAGRRAGRRQRRQYAGGLRRAGVRLALAGAAAQPLLRQAPGARFEDRRDDAARRLRSLRCRRCDPHGRRPLAWRASRIAAGAWRFSRSARRRSASD